jgi:Trk K+ transport system NAD-binding subunit
MSLKARLRYRFDNVMARGTGGQIVLLAVITLILVAIATLTVVILQVRPVDDSQNADSLGRVIWLSLMHAMDPGMIGGDSEGWLYLAIMLTLTIGGIFVVSALIGVLTQGFGDRMEALRRGRSAVVEQRHTVILGWDRKIFSLLGELAEANRNRRDACVVILADRDKVEMDTEIAEAMDGSRLRIVTRSGSPMSFGDLGLLALGRSRSVIVLSPDYHPDGSLVSDSEADTRVLKTLLAITKRENDQPEHIVAEIQDLRTGPVARMVAGERAALIQASTLISRLLVQSGRQPGLAAVYSELLDFAGVEIYVVAQPEVAGKTFREASFGYRTSTLIGVRTDAGQILLPPAPERRFEAGDQVIVISEDDDRIVLEPAVEPTVPPRSDAVEDQPAPPERTLILGCSPRLPVVLRELDAYAPKDSETWIVGQGDPDAIIADIDGQLQHMKVTAQSGDITDRGLLESLGVTGFDHILILSESEGRNQEMADARTTVCLLHLRDIGRQLGGVRVTSEILDIQSRNLASVGEPDDFIVSNMLVSLMVAQVSETPSLIDVFEELFTAEGHEIYLKPAGLYATADEAEFAVVCAAALQRGEVAIGYQLAARAHDPSAFGIVINPDKRARVQLGHEDRVIVLAEN